MSEGPEKSKEDKEAQRDQDAGTPITAAYTYWNKIAIANRTRREAFYVKYNANKA
ncbi:hypothetical protein BGZ50_006224 [Haplosporangium sp. Z 11]|nr:hypothetical protein BGZ50_006224 [Haplosporangium sp. Z 11]